VDAPETLTPLHILRQSAAAGDPVVFEAKVMGSAAPFVNRRAVMVVGDDTLLTSCDITHTDASCPLPWDLCCDDPDLIRAGTATVQVLDADGAVIRHGLKDIQTLRELSRVRILGRVDPQSAGDVWIVNAEGIEVIP